MTTILPPPAPPRSHPLRTGSDEPMAPVRTLLERLRLGTTVVAPPLAMIPLIDDGPPRPWPYLTLGHAIRGGLARVTEISETGSVPTLALRNDADSPVLLMDGEQLVGAKQNRVVNLTILAPPKQTLPIPVSCVEMGRWDYRSRDFRDSGDAMFASARARKTSDVSASLSSTGVRAANQSAVWEDIARRAADMSSASPTSAMSDIYEAHRAGVERFTRAFVPVAGQVGAIFLVHDRVVGIEAFGSSTGFAMYLPKIVRSYALDGLAARLGDVTDAAGSAGELLAAVTRARGERFRAIGMGDDLRFRSGSTHGAALLLDGEVVHVHAYA